MSGSIEPIIDNFATAALPTGEPQVRSTAGMTTKVVKGSLWTFVGQALPMAVALGWMRFIDSPHTTNNSSRQRLVGLPLALRCLRDSEIGTMTLKLLDGNGGF